MNREHAATDECPQCASTAFTKTLVKSAIWHNGNLAIIENIPAISCATCGEQFYDDTTAIVLDMMKGGGFGDNETDTFVMVPVFSFSNRFPDTGSPLPWSDE